MPHLEYAQTLQAYMEQFGLENIKLLLFEDLLADRLAFYRKICEAMGIEENEGIRLMDQRTDNDRWTKLQIESLQAIQKSSFQSLRFRMGTKATRKDMLCIKHPNTSSNNAPKATAPMSDTWKKKIFETTKKGNHRIEDVFKVNLQKYGYFGEI
jgi:hypothetical protein